ncbi:MAG: YidC/Oxa1 family membrane protein insertase [Armatimonadota bacterium]|nr:MAG: YidC/Oxa1 family membrane protein insertase [Armatimonadota bacterium]
MKSLRCHIKIKPGVVVIALVVGLGGLVAGGCMGRPQRPLPTGKIEELGVMLESVDRASDQSVRDQRHKWDDELRQLTSTPKPDPVKKASLEFAIGYAFECEEQYREAIDSYAAAAKGPLQVQARFRIGEIELLGRRERKAAVGAYSQAAMAMPEVRVWVRTAPETARPVVAEGLEWPSVLASAGGGSLRMESAAKAAQMRLDLLQRGDWRYQAISRFVNLLGGDHRYSHALALLLIAVIVKLVTTPLTSSSFRSIRAMQSLQPLIKELQEKHKGDRQAMAAEQMRLFKKHKINPLGGCLPMLIQMPILIGVYQGIRFYIYQLANAKFLWISNLALADTPLLIMYALSLYVSQKLTAMPQADPQQQQMQNTMTIMMPLMLTVLFASLPAAFILYWFFYNILITAHQYYLMRQPPPALAPAKEGGEGPPGKGKGRPRRKRRK